MATDDEEGGERPRVRLRRARSEDSNGSWNRLSSASSAVGEAAASAAGVATTPTMGAATSSTAAATSLLGQGAQRMAGTPANSATGEFGYHPSAEPFGVPSPWPGGAGAPGAGWTGGGGAPGGGGFPGGAGGPGGPGWPGGPGGSTPIARIPGSGDAKSQACACCELGSAPLRDEDACCEAVVPEANEMCLLDWLIDCVTKLAGRGEKRPLVSPVRTPRRNKLRAIPFTKIAAVQRPHCGCVCKDGPPPRLDRDEIQFLGSIGGVGSEAPFHYCRCSCTNCEGVERCACVLFRPGHVPRNTMCTWCDVGSGTDSDDFGPM